MSRLGRKRFTQPTRHPLFNRLTMNAEFAREFYDGERPGQPRTLEPPQAGGHGGQRVPRGASPGTVGPGFGSDEPTLAHGSEQRARPKHRHNRGENNEPRDDVPGPMH